MSSTTTSHLENYRIIQKDDKFFYVQKKTKFLFFTFWDDCNWRISKDIVWQNETLENAMIMLQKIIAIDNEQSSKQKYPIVYNIQMIEDDVKNVGKLKSLVAVKE